MNRRNIVIAVVAVLALGVGLVVYGILSAPRKVTLPPRPVVISSERIPLHAHIGLSMLEVVQRPTDQVPPDALTNPSDAIGTLSMSDIAEGTPITGSMIGRLATPPPPLLLVSHGERAITVAVDPVKGVSGLLRPGDRVDVLALPPTGVGQPKAYTILRNVRVLAIGAEVARPPAIVPVAAAPVAPGATPVPTPTPYIPLQTVTLAVPVEYADELLVADVDAVIRLALRPPGEPSESQPPDKIVFAAPLVATPAPAGVPVIQGDVEIQPGAESTASPSQPSGPFNIVPIIVPGLSKPQPPPGTASQSNQ